MNSYYPDVTVACAKIQTTDRYTESPALLVEVLSPSTAHQDISYKLHSYQAISTLRAYLIVSQDRNGSWLTFARRGTGWWSRHSMRMSS